MKYLKYCFPFFLLVLITPSSLLLAQQSVGFSDSTDFEYIIDYRLPDWGYSNFYIENGSLGTNGDYATGHATYFYNVDDHTVNNNQRNHTRVELNIRPAYQYYRESEKRVLHLSTRLSLSGDVHKGTSDINNEIHQNNNTEAFEYDTQQIDKSTEVRYDLDFTGTHYIANDLFLRSGLRTLLRYQFQDISQERKQESPYERQGNLVNRRLDIHPHVGIGFGRLRNVSPQLRALRMNERYTSLGNNSLSQVDIVEAAEHFTKIRGYQRTTDRYRKYFWGDMNQLVSNNLNALDTYDLFYLTDVLDENLGQRFEGYEVFLNSTLDYYNELYIEESTEDGIDSEERDININKVITTSASGIWFKNLNLNHQLSFKTEHQIRFPLETGSSLEWALNSSTEFSWVWTVTDKFMLTNSITNMIYKPEFKTRFRELDRYNTDTFVSSQLSYFIENKLSLTAQASLGFDTYNSDSPVENVDNHSIDWGLSVGVRYYFDRNLF